MNIPDRVPSILATEGPRGHEVVRTSSEAVLRARAIDRQVGRTLRAIRAAGGDPEAAITAGHRALARSIASV